MSYLFLVFWKLLLVFTCYGNWGKMFWWLRLFGIKMFGLRVGKFLDTFGSQTWPWKSILIDGRIWSYSWILGWCSFCCSKQTDFVIYFIDRCCCLNILVMWRVLLLRIWISCTSLSLLIWKNIAVAVTKRQFFLSVFNW